MLCAGMGAAEIRELLDSSQVRIKEYSKGDIVFHDGDMPRCIYILLEGEVHILKDTFSGRQIFLSEIDEAGDMFGEVYDVLEQPYDMYVEAVTKSKVLEISSHLLRFGAGGVMSKSALMVQQNLMRIFARKAYFMQGKIKVLASGSLREKIVRFLFQNLGQDGNVKLAISREYMAAYLAATRPSLSRELSAMHREGILAVDGKHIRVLDMDRFEEYL
nr:Crp/Fnr family transcriptional regulator [Selenomonas sp. ND2010]